MNLNPFINYNEDRECTTDNGEESEEIQRDWAAVDAEADAEALADAMVEDEPPLGDFEQAAAIRNLFEDEFRLKFRKLGMNPDLKLERTLQYEPGRSGIFVALSEITFGFRREFEYFFRRVGQEREKVKR